MAIACWAKMPISEDVQISRWRCDETLGDVHQFAWTSAETSDSGAASATETPPWGRATKAKTAKGKRLVILTCQLINRSPPISMRRRSALDYAPLLPWIRSRCRGPCRSLIPFAAFALRRQQKLRADLPDVSPSEMCFMCLLRL